MPSKYSRGIYLIGAVFWALMLFAPISELSKSKSQGLTSQTNSNNELMAQLEYMVWPSERQILLRKLRASLQDQINQAPLNGDLWDLLTWTDLQLDDIESAESSFLISNRLNYWRGNTRYNLARNCLELFSRGRLGVADSCKRVLTKLKEIQTHGVIAHRVGISENELRQWYLKLDILKN